MAKKIFTAQQIAEKLKEIDPLMKTRVDTVKSQVVATAAKVQMSAGQLYSIAAAAEGRSITLDRSGDNFRMTIY